MNKMKIEQIKTFILFSALLFATHLSGQGWERIYADSSNSAFGYQVFLEDNGDFLFNVDYNGSLQFLRTGPDGYQKDLFSYAVGSGALIRTGDSTFVAPTNLSTSSPSDPDDVRLSAFNLQGDILWQHTYGSDFLNQRISTAIQASNGDFVFAGGIGNPSPTVGYITKINEAGSVLWSEDIPNSFDLFSFYVVETQDQGFLLASRQGNGFAGSQIVVKYDIDGVVEWSTTVMMGQINSIIAHSDGNYVLLGSEGGDVSLKKLDGLGNEIWTQTHDYGDDIGYGIKLIETSDNGFGVLTTLYSGNDEIVLIKADVNGLEEWRNAFGSATGPYSSASDIKQTPDGGFVIAGSQGEADPKVYLIRTDADGVAFSNLIEGYVQYDVNEDCVNDAAEQAIEDWIISAVGTQHTYFGTTDEDGYYSISVDTGAYDVTISYPNGYWDACVETVAVQMPAIHDTVTVDYAIQSIAQCPLMEVFAYHHLLRLCAQNTLYVDYCNQGTELAEDVTVALTFDDSLSYVSASVPLLGQVGNTYTFDIGAVDFLECGSFQVQLTTGCDPSLMGQTLCTEAHIFPDSTCLPIDPEWDGASIHVDAQCIGDEVRLLVRNVGTGNMQAQLEYVVVEDDVIMMTVPFQLDSNDSIEVFRPSNGTFYLIASEQVPNHPGNSMPIAHIEACGVDGNGMVSLGFVNQFPLNDAEPAIDITCQEVVASYDPNEKLAYPRGYQSAHFIEENTFIEYVINFQNTGTDTAFLVVIEDQLSAFLDPTTIRPGASSHAYDFDLTGEGKLKFTFENIMLPDSNVNEAASHGFVQFTIAQQRDLPIGTQIFNEAAIFFDFNAPIITNQTYHTIGDDFIEVSIGEIERERVKIWAYPNPFSTSTNIQVEGENLGVLTIQLFDTSGRKIISDTFLDHTYELSRQGLGQGIYFYTISNESGIINTGKVMVH